MRPRDPRAVANLILDIGDFLGLRITNLALQKLLYFCHATYLVEKDEPFLKGYFEAWKFGPVNPAVYKAFKRFGSSPISARAVSVNPVDRTINRIPSSDDDDARRIAHKIVSTYGHMSPGRLVDVAHAVGAPWHFVVQRARESGSLGLRISDSVIIERFKYHKRSVTAQPRSGDPDEDAPLTRDRFGEDWPAASR